jgi:predicted RNase H-like HicB family nuclease
VQIPDYQTLVFFRDDGWVAEIPALPGCWAIGPTREQALWELGHVFREILAEHQRVGRSLPEDRESAA